MLALDFLECLFYALCFLIDFSPTYWFNFVQLLIVALNKWNVPSWLDAKLRPCASFGWPIVLILSPSFAVNDAKNLAGNFLGNILVLALVFSTSWIENIVLLLMTILLFVTQMDETLSLDFVTSISAWFVTFALVFLIPKNFSLAEAHLIASGLVLFVLTTWTNFFNDVEAVLNACLVGGVVTSMFLLQFHRHNHRSPNILIRYSFLISCLFIGLLFYAIFQYFTSLEPFVYLISIITEHPNIYILGYWIVILTLTFPILPRLESFSLELRRKFFHFLAILLFVPGTFFSHSFMSLAYKLALTLFLLFSLLSHYSLPPFPLIHQHLTTFVTKDHRTWDATLILSHVYLLIGCAIPLWMNVSEGYVGIIAVGMGDAVAALVGKRYGRRKWVPKCHCLPKRTKHSHEASSDKDTKSSIPSCSCLYRKSVEGTVASWMSMSFLDAVIQLVLLKTPLYIWARRCFVWALASLLETILDHNDNLVVPIWCTLMMQAIHYS